MSNIIQFPRQVLSYKKKGTAWRKSMLDWASTKTFFNCSPVRKSVENKKINYDLLNGILHIEDVERLLDPDNQRSKLIPKSIQHFPIMNTKLEVLLGEEADRVFDYRFVVTNPTAISEIEQAKKNMVLQQLQAIVEQAQSEDEAQALTQKLSDYAAYEWQDLREIRVNALVKHYSLEYNFKHLFNTGFMDALAVSEEIYMCDIVGGEPTIEKLNPLKVRTFQSGSSNKIEDADVIIIEDYWNPGRIIDTFYDKLTQKDIDYLEELPNTPGEELDKNGNVDDRAGFRYMMDDYMTDSSDLFSVEKHYGSSLSPYDSFGNVRVLRLFWKSKRKVKKVKSYNPEDGSEIYNFYTEDYIIDENMGEEEWIYWINQAWEGVKIGEDIYVNMGPRLVQYNTLSNPSQCHFGIVGSIYNTNESKPFSLVDRMKPFNYLYDVIHDRLNKAMARSWGKIIEMDLGKIPQNWKIDKWMYYAQMNGIMFTDSRNIINEGPATGKLVANLNNNSKGVLDADWGNNIQQYINLLEYIKSEMSEVAGISRQREGQISNRETVGGVERATLQSAHITERLFVEHEDVKKRALECFVETAKIALRGGSLKFEHILPDNAKTIIEIDGDEFSESDYGIVLDNTNNVQKLSQQIDQLAQFALQSQKISLSSVLKMYTSASLAEKMRILEIDERKTEERIAQQQQQQMEQQQQIAQMNAEAAEQELQSRIAMNTEDNETKIQVAQIQAESKMYDIMSRQPVNDGIEEPMTEEAKKKLEEDIRQFDAKISLERDRLKFDREKANKDAELKLKQINKQGVTR